MYARKVEFFTPPVALHVLMPPRNVHLHMLPTNTRTLWKPQNLMQFGNYTFNYIMTGTSLFLHS